MRCYWKRLLHPGHTTRVRHYRLSDGRCEGTEHTEERRAVFLEEETLCEVIRAIMLVCSLCLLPGT